MLKVHNGADSRPHVVPFLEAQNAALQHLHASRLSVPVPLAVQDGSLLTFEELAHPTDDTQRGESQLLVARLRLTL